MPAKNMAFDKEQKGLVGSYVARLRKEVIKRDTFTSYQGDSNSFQVRYGVRRLTRSKIDYIKRRLTLYPGAEIDLDYEKMRANGWTIQWSDGMPWYPPEVCDYAETVNTDIFAEFAPLEISSRLWVREPDATRKLYRQHIDVFERNLLREAQRKIQAVPFCNYAGAPVRVFVQWQDNPIEGRPEIARVVFWCAHCRRVKNGY